MTNIDKVLDTLVSGNYFVIFLILMLIILVVLVLCLVKSREEYNELLNYKLKEDYLEKENIANDVLAYQKENIEEDIKEKILDSVVEDKKDLVDEDNFFEGFDSLKALSDDDLIDENKPLIKQIDIPKLKTYNDIIEEYEMNEEECAVISAEELEKITQARKEALGVTENRQVIEKYEEDQERKAIISYDQLLKNASNKTLSYVEEKKKEENAPIINKIEVTQKEVTEAENYLEQEQYLKILKEFRLTL